MANDSIDHFKVLSETDLFSSMSISDHSISHEDHYSWISRTKTFCNNSKQLRTSFSNLSLSSFNTINLNQMLNTQNSNAPWLVNILTKKFHRSSREIQANNSRLLTEKFLTRQISTDGSNGRWIINEKIRSCQKIDQLNSFDSPLAFSTDDSLHLHHYHYEFPSTETPVISEDVPVDFSSIASMIQTYYTNKRQLTNSNSIQVIDKNTSSAFAETQVNDLLMINENSISKRISSRRQQRTQSKSRKKKSKYYQQRLLTSEEMQLRESLRLIDLDNIGFFPPKQLQKVLKEIGLQSHEIDKIERCLPLDDDGHYSLDNLVKLFLS